MVSPKFLELFGEMHLTVKNTFIQLEIPSSIYSGPPSRIMVFRRSNIPNSPKHSFQNIVDVKAIFFYVCSLIVALVGESFFASRESTIDPEIKNDIDTLFKC